MVKLERNTFSEFTKHHVMDKDLVIRMLTFENEFGISEEGQKYFKCKYLNPRTSLEPTYAIHRATLTKFEFDTSDESVKNYRSIFLNYYNSPTDYDNDVISCVYYMRNNKCVFYDKPIPQVGHQLTNCNLLNLDGSPTNLFSLINENIFNTCFIGAFSNS